MPGFLEVLRLALAARTAELWRREGDTWILEWVQPRDGGGEPGRVPAAAHPFSWALSEGLLLQVPREELFGDGRGWCLCGGPAGPGRVLCISFGATPGAAARPTLGPALAHLRELSRRSSPGAPARGD